MIKFSLTIVFDHRGRTEKEKEGPLEIRITVSRKAYYINTGIHVLRKNWAGSVVNRPDSDALNTRLGFLLKRTTEEINRFDMEGHPFDVDLLRKRIFEEEKKKEKGSLLKWIEKEIPLLKIGAGTMRRYDTLLNRLNEYKKISSWDDLTIENLYLWDHWLHNIKKPQSNGDVQAGKKAERIGDAAVYNYHRTLRALLTRAVKMGILDVNPYDRLRGEFRKGIKENVEYLTEEEIAAFESLHPVAGTPMAAARDLFIFQLYTGMSYSDAQAFDIKDYKEVDGKWIHTGTRIKTGVPFVSQLLPPVIDVLERYGWQTPKILNSDYNKCLKMLGMAAGIETRLHSHLARHTFATRMLRFGAKIENVSKMLGHTNITQTQKYAKVLAQSVHDDFERIGAMIEQKKPKKKR